MSQFCTYHDSSALVACGKYRPDVIIETKLQQEEHLQYELIDCLVSCEMSPNPFESRRLWAPRPVHFIRAFLLLDIRFGWYSSLSYHLICAWSSVRPCNKTLLHSIFFVWQTEMGDANGTYIIGECDFYLVGSRFFQLHGEMELHWWRLLCIHHSLHDWFWRHDSRWVGPGPNGFLEMIKYILISISQMMTSSNGNISPLLAICAGNSPVTVEFPAQRPVTRSFDIFFDLRLNKRLSKQWRG